MTTNSLIAAKIREIRRQKDYSAEYVASKLSISKAAYSQLENGNVAFTANKLDKLAQVFEMPIYDLFPNTQKNVFSNNNNATFNVADNIINNDPTIIEMLQKSMELLQKAIERMNEKK
jgi:transcriptional regulator with XRE-family HTH domain